MKKIRVATANLGKLREFREMLEPLGFAVHGLEDLPGFSVDEDGDTFEANALKKVNAILAWTDEPAVADDSGLVVDALAGAPGVCSARYAGVGGAEKDAANRRKLLAALQGVSDERRQARFVCALAYGVPGEAPRVFRGVLEGRIGHEERGAHGFGYDSLFVTASGRTAAELSAPEKHAISHRGQALRQLVAYLAGNRS